MARVSVIIPTHNRVDLLHDAVQSVLAQTYTDYEILVIDDGSTDNITEMLARLEAPVRYFRQEKSGASKARNTGIAHAQGEYIAFLDSDDLFFPEKLDEQVRYLDSYPEAGLVYSSYLHIDEQDTVIGESMCEMAGRIYPECLLICPIATPTVMIRHRVLDAVGRFDESMALAEDIDMWCRVARNYEIGLIAKPLTMVRFHASRTPRSMDDIIASQRRIIHKAYAEDKALGAKSMRRLMSRVYFGHSRVVLNEDKRLSAKLVLYSLFYWPPVYLSFAFETLSNSAKRLRATLIARCSPYPMLSGPVNFLLRAPKNPATSLSGHEPSIPVRLVVYFRPVYAQIRRLVRRLYVKIVPMMKQLLPHRLYNAVRSAWRTLKNR